MKSAKLSRRSALLGVASMTVLPKVVLGQEDGVEGGIGGTGIVGLLTDFGSLIVAGRQIETDQKTLFTSTFGRLSESDLALGDGLTVEAISSGGGLIARRVHLTYPLVGAISDVSGDTVVVNGVQVMLEAMSPLATVGQRVAVSGVWRGTSVVASRLSEAPNDMDVIAGDVSRDILGSYIGGISVVSPQLSRQEEGSYATVTGRYDQIADRLRVQKIDLGRFGSSAGPLRRLAVEGYLEPVNRAPGYRISGLGHSFSRNLNLAQFANDRVLFSGPYLTTFAANRAVLLSEDFDTRRAVLKALSQS